MNNPHNNIMRLVRKFGTIPGNKSYLCISRLCLFVFWRDSLQWAMASSFTWFLDHTQRCTTVGRTPPDEWSALRRDLTTHNIQNRQTSMPPGGIRTLNLSRRAAADLRLRRRGHWDRPFLGITRIIKGLGKYNLVPNLCEIISIVKTALYRKYEYYKR
jgi:hypothetical protein